MRGGQIRVGEFRISRQSLVAVAFFVAGAAASGVAWRISEQQLEQDARTRFDGFISGAVASLQARLRGYSDILYGVQGLFNAEQDISRVAFHRYVFNLGLAERIGTLRSISYAQRVPAAEREAFERRVRTDVSMSPAGYPGFAVHPPMGLAEHVAIVFIEPFAENAAALGLDLLGDPVRRRAVERTRDTGAPATGRAFALHSVPGPDNVGVSLRLAVYREGLPTGNVELRREAFAGIVSATFLLRDLFGAVLTQEQMGTLALRLTDIGAASGEGADAPALMFEHGPRELGGARFVETAALGFGDRRWMLEIAAPRDMFVASGRLLPWVVLSAGLTISALLAGLLGALLSSRARALRLAQAMTEDLRRSEARLAEAQRRTQELIEALPNPIFFKDTAGRYLGVNKAWEAYFGISREAFVGRTVFDLYPNAPDVAERLDAMDQELWRLPGVQEHEASITTPSGEQRDTIYYKATYSDADGAVAGLIGTIIDITERKRVERRQRMEHDVTRALAEAASPEQAVPQAIRLICEAMDWACGARWQLDAQARVLRCRERWTDDDPVVRAFIEDSANRSIALEPVGQGLVRRSQASGETVWIADFAAHQGFIRSALAMRAGLTGGVAIPLPIGGEVLGVLEFFFRGVRQPDPSLLEISRSVGSQIGQFLARKQVEEAVRFVATHDSLTDLPNRLMFQERLEHALTQARRHGRSLALLFIDLDRFKLINDTLGHEAGDALLREVARRLREQVRAGDTVARLGGDEFVVLLEEIGDPMYVGAVARKLTLALAEPVGLQGRELHVSASIGVSTFPGDASESQELLRFADLAMYRAKERGRNTFQFYSSELNRNSLERLNLEAGLRRALERGELELHYQPQVELGGGGVRGVEALVRWRHPELGLLGPARFIALAEETGLIVPIGELVLRMACAAQARFAAGRPEGLRVAVNLSPRQFLHGDLVRDIQRVLDETRCPPAALELEITEGMVMQDPRRAVKLLRRLKERGVRTAIDDFGTGYSSLAYLRQFPIDSLKVDRSFVREVPGDSGNTAITQAIIAMARSLNLRVIAEGVETQAQHDFLLAQGCDEYQGYFFSPPLPESEALARIRAPRCAA